MIIAGFGQRFFFYENFLKYVIIYIVGRKMEVTKIINGTELCISIEGSLDTTTAPKLEKEIGSSLDGITTLIFDFKDLEYISSAGLRVLLAMQKIMNKQGRMKVINANETVIEIFEVTGFIDILTVE